MSRFILKEEEISKFVTESLLPLLEKRPIFALYGPLGAGKTTLVRELIRQLGLDSVVTSPTFTYLKKYVLPDRRSVYHFDLYRLDSLDSFLEMGFDEYFEERESFVFIEWPEVIEPLLDDKPYSGRLCKIFSSYVQDDLKSREVEIFFKKNVCKLH